MVKIPFMKQISWYLVIIMFLIGIAPKVDAGLAPSELLSLSQYDRVADLEKIQKAIEIKAVSERLKQFGLTQDEIHKRLSQLSDQQIHQIALQLDSLNIGKDNALGVIIALLIIAILVVILLKLTGHRVIITK
ncbi:MAG: PA2779 family protein [Nitrospirae bacterium]|nr:PA2779 family protein [Nitrospirota bacterium]